MTHGHLSLVLRNIRQLANVYPADDATDGQLLAQFAACRQETAFAALLKRHGPMVLNVCQRLLRHGHDVEDAFQATFLLLARKAASLRKPQSVGSWLHGV